jgi:hypothetical protein
MVRFGEPMLEVVLRAGQLEGVASVQLARVEHPPDVGG